MRAKHCFEYIHPPTHRKKLSYQLRPDYIYTNQILEKNTNLILSDILKPQIASNIQILSSHV
jgi:hypothetical protein